MMNVKVPLFVFMITLCISFPMKVQGIAGEDHEEACGFIKDKYDVMIIMDTIDDWSSGIRNGFKDGLSKALAESQRSVNYTVIDTQLKKENVPGIIQKIKSMQPDLICTINFPTAFSDIMITQKLKGPEYKFVSENCVPIESGTIQSWKKPGGNVTGVGVFIQMNSPIRLIKKLNPEADKLVFFTWDQMELANQWFREEVSRAAKEEGVQLVTFKTLKHHEEAIEFLSKYSHKGMDYFAMPGISVFVNKEGEFINAGVVESKWIRENMKIGLTSFDENDIKYGKLAGTCVIWYDIGAQLAEKGIRILKGENPGDIPWDYPRKYNIIINRKRAQDLGVTIPQDIINASYRIYTDYHGSYIGQGK
ncbi:MAG: ABC transporter substrate binding protein [Desulfobacteraceae bacterium]